MPTAVGVLGLGANSVTGMLNVNEFDPDAFSFSVPAGQELTNLYFANLTGFNRFFVFNEGALDTSNAYGNLVTTLISTTDVMTNILDGSLNSVGGSGVSGPLGPGSYEVWFQETDGSVVDYTINLETSVVPEPGALALVLLGGFVSLLAYRKQS